MKAMADGFTDFLLGKAPAEVLARLAAAIQETFGVTLKQDGGVYTLTCGEAWVQKDHSLTFYGAWRTAAHLWRCTEDPQAAAREVEERPRFGNRQTHKQQRKS